jgi:hypothetical protein
MTREIDILFITHLQLPRDTGGSTVYQPLRLEIQGQAATIPVLRALAQGGDVQAVLGQLAKQRAAVGIPPVLTPIYLQDYMARRGLNLVDIPCLETHSEQVKEALGRGVRLIALSTTWLPGSKGAVLVREAAARLRAIAAGVPIVAGGVGVRKGLRALELLRQGQVGEISEQELAQHYVLISGALDRDQRRRGTDVGRYG